MKAQSLVIQFLLFFIIGLVIFLAIGNFYRLQSDIFRQDVADLTRRMISSYASSFIVISQSSCKECDFASAEFKIENLTANYFVELYLDQEGLRVVTVPGNKLFLSAIHNINSTLNPSGFASSVEPIKLTIKKIENTLEVGR